MGDALRPDGVLLPDGRPVRRYGPLMREALMALPNLVKLLTRLLRDPRVSARSKAIVFFTLGYLIVPIDVIPDIPVIGQTDDVLLIAFALNHLIREAGEQIVLEHWDGSEDVLEIVSGLVDFGAGLVPKRLRMLFDRFGR